MKKNIQVLILEDRPLDAELIVHELRGAGFDPDWQRVDTEGDFLAGLKPDFDVILADFTLPRFDSLRALDLLQERGLDIPFIIVSGTIGEETAVAAMKQGARDYVLKDRLARLGQAVANALEQTELRNATRQAEEALRQSEYKYRHLFENLSDAAFLAEVESGRILDTNRQGEKLLDRAREEIIGLNQCQLHPSAQTEDYRKWYAAHGRQASATEVEGEILKRDGNTVPVHVSLVPVALDGKACALGLYRDITESKQTEAQIAASLKEKEALIKEIHHRVKNNLQIISSLLNLQAGSIEDPRARELFQDSQARVKTMALIHEKLYQSRDLAGIPLDHHLRDLVLMILRSHSARSNAVTAEFHVDALVLGIETAVPLSLIVNELVTNCLKHAFPNGKNGTITIQFHQDPQQCFHLVIHDDGVGFPTGFTLDVTASLGLRLVKILTEQLGGQLACHNRNGAEFELTFRGRMQNERS